MEAKRILAVENNELVLDFLQTGLATAGYQVDTARNGREALEMIDGTDYDLIISDMLMPELDGAGLCRALLARQSDAVHRIVLLTGSDDISDGPAFEALPSVPTFAKPVGLEELRRLIERMTDAPMADAAVPGNAR